MKRANEKLISKHLDKLCNDIGVRLAGTREEQLAAEYLAEALEKTGAKVEIETFPVNARCVKKETLEIKTGGRWQKFKCSLFSNTPGTDGALLEAPLVFFEAPAEYQRADLNHLRGKAVVHLGCHIKSQNDYKRLLAARPAFLLMVDIRYPGDRPLADGMFPHYSKTFGAVPTLNVAFMDAWNWRLKQSGRAKIRITGGMKPAESQNVIAELPGADDSAIFFAGGHHDTQADCPGADDNAVGSIAMLELARILAAEKKRRHPVRLISFGAEEQLSEGSVAYVRKHFREISRNGAAMFNFDGFGSQMGWYRLMYNGPPAFGKFMEKHLRQKNFFAAITEEAFPFGDHFPFVAAGIPGCMLYRQNCATGRFFHHRRDDDITRVSTAGVAKAIDVFAELMADLACRTRTPFTSKIPVNQRAEINSLWNDIFGGWK